MIIFSDTREQAPLSFQVDIFLTEVKRTALPVGDYAVEWADGETGKTYFERKSLSDLFTTMTLGYTRFKKEMERAKEFGVILVLIIEGSLTDVWSGACYSSFEGSSMVKKLMTLEHRYGLRTVYCQNRSEMAMYIKHWFIAEGAERARGKSA